MTYETISVRMNRSDRNIRWGFTVRQQADGLIIDRVEVDSLSDKAGVKHSDKVEQINGRATRGLDAATANRLIDDSFNEVRLSLQRFVTSHTCLPWTLNEKDNKMVVEEMKPGFGGGFGSGTTHFNNTAHGFGGNSTTNNHRQQQSSTFHSSSSAQNHHGSSFGTHNIPINTQSSRAPFTTNNNISSTTNYISPSNNNYNSTPTAFNSGYGGKQNGHIAPPATYSYNNGATTQNYGTGAGGTPLNQMTFINTTPLSHGPPSGLSPSRLLYHSPSGRSRNELSPGASVHHLQYNSPMNLYSSEATAEQLYQQTGQTPQGPVPHDKTPAYLTSETKRLIEEEARGRNSRGKSPSSQSSCFKRISHAVGADN